jgi:predicted nucleic acid-binding Zn ribbon protein
MEPARTGLRNIMKELLRACPEAEAVTLAWPLVCGNDVAQRTRAVEFVDGCLTVAVSDSAWATQLKGFGSRYVSGYEALLGPLVKEVKFNVQHSGLSNQRSATPG